MDFDLRYLAQSDLKGMAEVRALLQQEGLLLDQHLDRTLGLYDQAGLLVATGSTFANTLRCLAVDQARQGEGLMARVVSRLVEDFFHDGIHHVFVYTKPEAAWQLADLGFYPIVQVPGSLVFMENRRDGFSEYLSGLAGAGAEGEVWARLS